MFHVFVEGAKDSSRTGIERLAAQMAEAFGIPETDLATRLGGGRFRVKANIDRPTAEKFAKELDRLGARCTIESAVAGNSRPTPPSGYSSGLSAAFSGEMPAASLGALEGGGALSLSSVDGSDDGASAGAAPAEMMSASIGPAPDKPKSAPGKAKSAKPKDEPLDLFAPPDAAEAGAKLELHTDEVAHTARKRASTPPASVPVVAEPPARAASTPAMRRSQPSIQAQNAPIDPPVIVAPTSEGRGLGNERVRFAAGVVVAILVGFAPAHFIAAWREKSAYEEIDRKVLAAQAVVETPEAYAALDHLRDDQLERKASDRRSIAMMAMLIWAIAGAGVAYAWFRKIPWERFES